jgi:hypothetical protein
MLESVIDATLVAGDEPLSANELESFRTVARRHSQRPLVEDPILVELVDAILAIRFPAQRARLDASQWWSMCHDVAQSLWSAPAVQARIIHFWSQLCESVR